jgi:membrane-associated protein
VSVPSNLGYLALAVLVGGESLGLLLPGETAILTAGVLARSGSLDLFLVLPIAACAAIVGDGIGFLLGRRGLRMFLVMRGPWRARRARFVERGEDFFARHGPPAVFFGRWVVFARVTIPWLAGASGMPPRRFFLYNVLGGSTWSITVALAGYAFGLAAGAVFTGVTVAVLALLLVLALRAAWRRGTGPR